MPQSRRKYLQHIQPKEEHISRIYKDLIKKKKKKATQQGQKKTIPDGQDTWTIHERRWLRSQQTQNKVLHPISNQIKTTMKYYYTLSRMAKIESIVITCIVNDVDGASGTLTYCWWYRRVIQRLGKLLDNFQYSKIYTYPLTHQFHLLYIQGKLLHGSTKRQVQICTAALLIKPQTRGQSKCLNRTMCVCIYVIFSCNLGALLLCFHITCLHTHILCIYIYIYIFTQCGIHTVAHATAI